MDDYNRKGLIIDADWCHQVFDTIEWRGRPYAVTVDPKHITGKLFS